MYNKQFSQNPTIDRADKCVTKLKGIASIQSGDRWNTYQGAPQKSGVLTSISRSLWCIGEERRLNLADISATIDTAFTILEDIYVYLSHLPNNDYHYKKYQATINLLKSNILDARDGMNNLKVVYHDDAGLCHNIDKKFGDIRDRYRDLEDRYIEFDGDSVVRWRTPPRTFNTTSNYPVDSEDQGSPTSNSD